MPVEKSALSADGPPSDLASDLAGSSGGGLGRRELLLGAAALGLAGLTPETGNAQAGRGSVPLKGGHLVLGLSGGGPTDTLDPAGHVASFMANFSSQYSDSLTVLGEDFQVKPALATSWEAKPGATEWIVKLRRGVTFHNGKELTAADVIHSINHHRNPKVQSVAFPNVAGITDIWDSDKYEVTITLDSGNADLPVLLADHRLGIAPDESKFIEGIGTGAFAIEYFKPGVRGGTKRNPNDWRSDRGHVASVETVAIGDFAERVFSIQSGVVHVIDRLDPKAAANLDPRRQTQVFNSPGGSHGSFAMFTDAAPYSNLELRLALKYAIDRQAIIQSAFHGAGRLGNDHPIPPGHPYYASELPQRPHDLERAKFHYRRSAHRGKLQLVIAEAAFPGAVEAARQFQVSAANAGITIDVRKVANEAYWKDVWLKQPFAASYWQARTTADHLLTMGYSANAPWNDTHWKRPSFDQVLAQARAELDVAKRRRMYRDAQASLYREGGAIVPLFYNNIVATHQRVRGFVPHPLLDMSGYRVAEKVWFEI